jgi:hypothetical protein
MTARDIKRQSLKWVSGIRDAQAQQAGWAARETVAAVGVAMARRLDAETHCDDAMVEWNLALAESTCFDPALAAIWAHEVSIRDAKLSEAEDAVFLTQQEQARASNVWQQTEVRAKRAADNLAIAKRKADSHRAEQQLAVLADFATLRHVT